MNSFGRIIDILIVSFMMFIMPLQYMGMKQDYATQTMVTAQTALFTDSIRNKGCIDSEMLTRFQEWLDKTGNLYDIEISHYKKIYSLNEENNEYVMEYEYCSSETVMEGVLGDEGSYVMEIGDFISVTVMSKNRTIGEKMRSMIMGTEADKGIYVVYGGVIRDEAY